MKHFNNIILASNSPRRKQLLNELGLDFKVRTIKGLEELYPETLNTEKVAEYLAIEKNKPYREKFKNEIIITADTVVIFSDKILGKPKDSKEAKKTLQLLSGKIHSVMSAVCISDENKTVSFSSTTEVKFHELTNEEIDHYVSNWPPTDKAGSYGIQEWIGLVGVEWIKGSYFNVMGLPVDKVYKTLIEEF